MKIIISPAKKMNVDTDSMPVEGLPVFLERANLLKDYIRTLTYEEAKTLWKCNDKIAELNYERFQRMDLSRNMTPAVLAYEGLQYQYMAPSVFERRQWDYINRSLRILSGFYGILSPSDGVVPYRLEMQARVALEVHGLHCKNLYEFWGDSIFRQLTDQEDVIVNLASKEYSKAVEPWLRDGIRYVTCTFGCAEENGNFGEKIRVKATEAKMARGEMVRFLAERYASGPEEMKLFAGRGFRFREDLSDESNYVFVKK